MAHFTITSDSEFSGATVIFGDGTTQTIGSDNPNYAEVVQHLLAGDASDEDLLNLIAPFELVYKQLTKLSERVSRKGMRLFFDGDPVANALALHIIKVMDSGAPEAEWKAYLRFWEKASANPSTRSQDELFLFIEKHGLLLTPDGDAVFYKGTDYNGKSTRAGYGIVDGVEFENAHLQNKVGSVVEIPRSMVDDNRGIACSVGLHVGDFSYASTFGNGKLFTVLVNPRDVVSVPSDHNDRKIRVCRYTVVEENTKRVKYDGTIKVFDVEKPEAPAEEPKAEAPSVLTVNVQTKKLVYPEGSRVPEYKDLISALVKADPQVNLKRYKNKKITAGRRDEFESAANELGFKL